MASPLQQDDCLSNHKSKDKDFVPYWARCQVQYAKNLLEYSSEPIEYDYRDNDGWENCFFFPEDCSRAPATYLSDVSETETEPDIMDGSSGRNIFIEISTEPGVEKAGFCAPPTCTKREFLAKLDILFKAPSGFDVKLSGQHYTIRSSNQPVQPGRYILSPRAPGEEISAGEPLFDFDLASDSDTMGIMQQGPRPAERMEEKLLTRLYGHD